MNLPKVLANKVEEFTKWLFLNQTDDFAEFPEKPTYGWVWMSLSNWTFTPATLPSITTQRGGITYTSASAGTHLGEASVDVSDVNWPLTIKKLRLEFKMEQMDPAVTDILTGKLDTA